jgi:predicted nucleic acid-binding protein
MIVLDTNLLVRLATGDNVSERNKVIALLEKHQARIAKTVLLETEWVLRSRYGYSNQQFCEFIGYLVALPCVAVEDELLVQWAVGASREGLDFSDAMHVALAVSADEVFYTFDKKLHRRASKLKGARVQIPK